MPEEILPWSAFASDPRFASASFEKKNRALDLWASDIQEAAQAADGYSNEWRAKLSEHIYEARNGINKSFAAKAGEEGMNLYRSLVYPMIGIAKLPADIGFDLMNTAKEKALEPFKGMPVHDRLVGEKTVKSKALVQGYLKGKQQLKGLISAAGEMEEVGEKTVTKSFATPMGMSKPATVSTKRKLRRDRHLVSKLEEMRHRIDKGDLPDDPDEMVAEINRWNDEVNDLAAKYHKEDLGGYQGSHRRVLGDENMTSLLAAYGKTRNPDYWSVIAANLRQSETSRTAGDMIDLVNEGSPEFFKEVREFTADPLEGASTLIGFGAGALTFKALRAAGGKLAKGTLATVGGMVGEAGTELAQHIGDDPIAEGRGEAAMAGARMALWFSLGGAGAGAFKNKMKKRRLLKDAQAFAEGDTVSDLLGRDKEDVNIDDLDVDDDIKQRTKDIDGKTAMGGKGKRFVADFLSRIKKFAGEERFSEFSIEFVTDEELSEQSRGRAGEYDVENKTIRLSTEFEGNLGNGVIDALVHESGHFSESLLEEGFLQQEWAAMTEEQRKGAAEQYLGREVTVAEADGLINDATMRSEWWAMQVSRVASGDTKGMSNKLIAKIQEFLDIVRGMVNEYIGDGQFTTEQVDAKIQEMLGLQVAQEGQQTAQEASKQGQTAQDTQIPRGAAQGASRPRSDPGTVGSVMDAILDEDQAHKEHKDTREKYGRDDARTKEAWKKYVEASATSNAAAEAIVEKYKDLGVDALNKDWEAWIDEESARIDAIPDRAARKKAEKSMDRAQAALGHARGMLLDAQEAREKSKQEPATPAPLPAGQDLKTATDEALRAALADLDEKLAVEQPESVSKPFREQKAAINAEIERRKKRKPATKEDLKGLEEEVKEGQAAGEEQRPKKKRNPPGGGVTAPIPKGETVKGDDYEAQDIPGVTQQLTPEQARQTLGAPPKEDGKEGKALSAPPASTSTQEFKKWFGKSEAAAPDGRPLTLFAKVPMNFSVFRPEGAPGKYGMVMTSMRPEPGGSKVMTGYIAAEKVYKDGKLTPKQAKKKGFDAHLKDGVWTVFKPENVRFSGAYVSPHAARPDVLSAPASAKDVETKANAYLKGKKAPERSAAEEFKKRRDIYQRFLKERIKYDMAKDKKAKDRTDEEKKLAKLKVAEFYEMVIPDPAERDLVSPKSVEDIYSAYQKTPMYRVPMKTVGKKTTKDYDTGFTEEERDAIAETMAYEAAEALTQDGNALGWYDRQMKTAIREAKRIFPELAKKPQQAVFKAMTAITSNGQRPKDQFPQSYKLFDEWLMSDQKQLPVNIVWGGKRANSMRNHFRLLQKLIDEVGLKGAQEFLDSYMTASDLNKFGKKYLGATKDILTGEAADAIVKGSMMFGPKIGNFYQNISGDFSAVTMDMWFMRTMGRMIGDLMFVDPKRRAEVFERLEKEAKAAGVELPAEGPELDAWISKKQKANDQRYAEFRKDPTLPKPTNDKLMLAVNTYAGLRVLKESPKSPYERREIRRIVRRAQDKLREAGIFLTNADFQALIWYYEKDIVESSGGEKRSAQSDYAAASVKLRTFKRASKPGGGKPSKVTGPARQKIDEHISLDVPAGQELGMPMGTVVPEQATLSAPDISQTKTKEFKDWFGDSKVVDADGNPAVMYHGTFSEFDTFDTTGFTAHIGTVDQANNRLADVTKNKRGTYRGGGRDFWMQHLEGGAGVMPVFAKVSNPIELTDAGNWRDSFEVASVMAYSKKYGHDPEMRKKLDDISTEAFRERQSFEGSDLDDGFFQDEQGNDIEPSQEATAWTESLENQEIIDELRSILKKDGFDGVVYANQVEGNQDSYIVFEPTQLKSATGNTGQFDPTNPSILSAPSLDSVKKAGKAVASIGARELRVRGHMPQEAHNRLLKRNHAINALMRLARFATIDYQRGLKGMSKAEKKAATFAANTYLTDKNVSSSTVPAEIREPVERMRAHIDDLSRIMIREGMIQGDLLATVTDNLGMYLHRSYRAFDDPKWKDKMLKSNPDNIIGRAQQFIANQMREEMLRKETDAAWLVQANRKRVMRHDRNSQEWLDIHRRMSANPNIKPTRDQVMGQIEGILDRQADQNDFMPDSSKTGRKNLDVLKRRSMELTFAPVIRELMGEYKDPLVNYSKTFFKMAQLIENDRFLKDIRKLGLKEGWLSEERLPGMTTKLASGTDRALIPLVTGKTNPGDKHPNNIYTTKEIAGAFRDYSNIQKEKILYRWWMKAHAATKVSKTILSWPTQVRNHLANYMFVMANGHFRPGPMKEAIEFLRKEWGDKNDSRWRNYTLKLAELGILGESVNANELREVMAAAGADMNEIMDFTDNRALKAMKGGFRKAEKAYRMNDEVFKILGFENEKIRWRQAEPRWTEAQVEKAAAQRVLDTYPTYSKTPKITQRIRRSGLIGTFVSFPSEVMRVAFNTLRFIIEDFKAGRHQMAIERLMGAGVASVASDLAWWGTMQMVGMSFDDDEKFRRFLPPWMRNSNLIYLSREDGQVDAIDLSYVDPWSYLKTPLIALAQGQSETAYGRLFEGVAETLRPFVDETIIFKAADELVNNRKRTGGRIYNPSDPATIPEKAFAHLWRAFEPGTITAGKRVWKGATGYVDPWGRKYDFWDEMVSAAGGVRRIPVDIPQALTWRGRRFRKTFIDDTVIYSEPAKSQGEVDQDDVDEAYIRSEAARESSFTEIHRDADAAMTFGVSRGDVIKSLRDAGLSKDMATRVVGNRYEAQDKIR